MTDSFEVSNSHESLQVSGWVSAVYLYPAPRFVPNSCLFKSSADGQILSSRPKDSISDLRSRMKGVNPDEAIVIFN